MSTFKANVNNRNGTWRAEVVTGISAQVEETQVVKQAQRYNTARLESRQKKFRTTIYSNQILLKN
jgi:hypothetical protein